MFDPRSLYRVLVAASLWVLAAGVVAQENRPPVAAVDVASPAECTSPAGAVVRLDGRGSTDPDSTPGTNDDIVRFEWFSGDPLIADLLGLEATVDVSLPLGSYNVTLRVIDAAGAVGLDGAPLEVVDTTPPFGNIVDLEPICYGPSDLPIYVDDDIEDACDEAFTRSYEPQPRPWLTLGVPAGAPRGLGMNLVADEDTILAAGTEFGAVVFYERETRVWSAQRFPALGEELPGAFGHSVAIQDDIAVIGAPEDDEAGPGAGAAYLLRREAQGWVILEKMLADDGGTSAGFGHRVGIDGDKIAVTTRTADGLPGTGAVFVYQRQGEDRRELIRLTSRAPNDRFGNVLSLNEGWMFLSGESWGAARHRNLIYDVRGDFVAAVGLLRETNYRDAVAIGDGHVAAAYRTSVRFFRQAPWWWEYNGEKRLGSGEFDPRLLVDGDRLLVGTKAAIHELRLERGRWNDRRTLERIGVGRRYPARVAYAGDDLVFGAPSEPGIDPSGRIVMDQGGLFVYQSDPQPFYDEHGIQDVLVRAEDRSGNVFEARMGLVIDREPPQVEFVSGPSVYEMDAGYAVSRIFEATDDDGAAGGVTRERMFLDDCLFLDGDEYGDRDGLLRDEVVRFDEATLCELAERCRLDQIGVESRLRVEAEDCAGLVGVRSRRIGIGPGVRLATCP